MCYAQLLISNCHELQTDPSKGAMTWICFSLTFEEASSFPTTICACPTTSLLECKLGEHKSHKYALQL